ncbi:RluA family pseudouridine synthase [Clostridiaceae bacterium M8S5]|nr:RluA family pseudouridine synthase [Clostridiaceae bacterium M8S5]
MQIENQSTIIYIAKSNHESVFDAFIDEMGLSARFFKSLVKDKSIQLNGQNIKRKSKVYIGDIIKISMKDETPVYSPQNIPLNILYEDMDLLLINKPPFMLVHPTKNHTEGTLSNGIAYYFKDKKIHKKVRLINRLDMNTSGIVIVAKNPFGHIKLANQMEKNYVVKKYIAVVDGVINEDDGVIDLPIGKDETDSVKNKVIPSGKNCMTKYGVIKRYKSHTLLELELLTGRTHQIRVHLSHIGHPIVGDSLYNKNNTNIISRQALHANYISFLDPRNSQRINIKAEYPKDIEKLLKNINEE